MLSRSQLKVEDTSNFYKGSVRVPLLRNMCPLSQQHFRNT